MKDNDIVFRFMSQSGQASNSKANKSNASNAEQILCKELQPILQMVSAVTAVLQPCYSIIESASNLICHACRCSG